MLLRGVRRKKVNHKSIILCSCDFVSFAFVCVANAKLVGLLGLKLEPLQWKHTYCEIVKRMYDKSNCTFICVE